MRIKRISFKNFRCFYGMDIDLDDRITVIVGNNGAGKTSVLEGIAVACGTFFSKMDLPTSMAIKKKDVRLEAYEIGATDDVQPQYPVEIKAAGEIDGYTIEWKRGLNSGNGKTTLIDAKEMTNASERYQKKIREGVKDLILPVIAYYGTGRLWDYHKEKRSDTFRISNRANGYIDCLDGTANIKLMMNWFQKSTIQMAQKSANGLNAYLSLPVVYQAMKLCYERMSGYQGVRFEFNLDTFEIDCFYTDNDGLQMRMPLSQMSDGYKSTISLVADIAYRMAVLNPQLGTGALEKTDGIVMIDEVDLHLHPAWQHRILSDLMEIFPKVQFIVTTHAPAVISSVKAENLVILENNGTRYAGSEVYGNDVNSILKQIMLVEDRNPAVSKLFDQFYEYLEAKAYSQAENTLDEIEARRDYHDQEAVKCRVKLKLDRIRGEQA